MQNGKSSLEEGLLKMRQEGTSTMGRISVDVELRNYRDVILAGGTALPQQNVRSAKIQGNVDTGAAHLVIPQSAATRLGVPVVGTAVVRYADRRHATRQVLEPVEVHLLGRHAVFQARVEPDRDDALIGAIVLEALDFIVDCGSQTLTPRDPDRIISEVE
jgi:predicted aspartyl protease